MDKIRPEAQKHLDKNGTGVVPKNVWYGRPAYEYDRPEFCAVVKGAVQFSGTKAQCKRWVSAK